MKLGTLALKVLGFFTFVFSFFMWGSTKAKLRQAIKEKNIAIKESKRISENNAMPYVDNPAMCLYDKAEDDIPEDEEKISDEAS